MNPMKKFFVFATLLIVLGCGRIDKQYNKILSPESTQTTKVTCHTVFGVPYFCLEKKDTFNTVIEYIEVEKIVRHVGEIIVVAEKREAVPVEDIVQSIRSEIGSASVSSYEEVVEDIMTKITDAVGDDYVIDVSVGDIEECCQ